MRVEKHSLSLIILQMHRLRTIDLKGSLLTLKGNLFGHEERTSLRKCMRLLEKELGMVQKAEDQG